MLAWGQISGFDRFSGVEGLRGCCNLRAVTSDKVTGVRTTIPPPLQYPVEAAGFTFVSGLVSTVYGDGALVPCVCLCALCDCVCVCLCDGVCARDLGVGD